LSSVCYFATDIHSASLGKGKNDDTLVKVRNGDLTGKGELVVCQLNLMLRNVGLIHDFFFGDDLREAGIHQSSFLLHLWSHFKLC
jgi:hypothetical protein